MPLLLLVQSQNVTPVYTPPPPVACFTPASWSLGGSYIPAASGKNMAYDIQEVTHRTLNGKFTRDFIGATKRIFKLSYQPISQADWSTIIGHWADQRDHGTSKQFVCPDMQFSGNVIISIDPLDYNIKQFYEYFDVAITLLEA